MNNERWKKAKADYRLGVSWTLHQIEQGQPITQDELAALRNFCSVALMAQHAISEHVWRRCEKQAETAAHVHGQVEDSE